MCQHLLATACKAGRGNAARVPLILRAMGECGLRPDMSLLESLEMLLEANRCGNKRETPDNDRTNEHRRTMRNIDYLSAIL